jgi:hypothetical protein
MLSLARASAGILSGPGRTARGETARRRLEKAFCPALPEWFAGLLLRLRTHVRFSAIECVCFGRLSLCRPSRLGVDRLEIEGVPQAAIDLTQQR